MRKEPLISIVGAGPGDPDLITVKGMKTLQTADVVLYDALVNKALLEHVPSRALTKCVGKRAGKHSFKQDDIQMMMVQYAFKHGHVVRLKGGDPFVFGRGHEELDFARAFDIDTRVIPGISSAIAVPANQGIPVTHRGLSESFWVVTATTKKGKLSDDLALAAQSSATVVILMGMRKLAQIVSLFQEHGKGNCPTMIIQNGTLESEKCILSTMDDIEKKARASNVGTPALIVVGETVRLHTSFIQQVKSAVA